MIKSPNVAGQFYDANPLTLTRQIRQFIDSAQIPEIKNPPGVLIVPHAGYVYSGPVAAHAFKAISGRPYRTVILLGPTHLYQFPGVAIWPGGGFKTPLGTIAVDAEMSAALMAATGQITPQPNVFARDHVLEVEMPFLQTVLGEFRIVPLIMNRDASPETLKDVAAALAAVTKDRDDVLLIISSDMSHYHPDDEARAIDRRGLDAVVAGDIERLWNGHADRSMEIDGFKEVITALMYAKARGFDHIELLNYGTSGDTSGDRSKVVGYSAVMMTAP